MMHTFAVEATVYIYYDCKLLEPVVYFAEPDTTSLLVILAKQRVQYA